MKQKITQEQFNKLNQLDRIEFRQRKDWIDKNRYPYSQYYLALES